MVRGDGQVLRKKIRERCESTMDGLELDRLQLGSSDSNDESSTDSDVMPELVSSSDSSSSDSGLSESIGQVTSLCRDRRPDILVKTGKVTTTGGDMPVSLGFSDASVASDGWEELYDMEGNPTGMEVLEIGVKRLALDESDEDNTIDRVMLERDGNIGIFSDDYGGVVVKKRDCKVRVLLSYLLWVVMACWWLRLGTCNGLMHNPTCSGRETSALNSTFTKRSGHEKGAFNMSPKESDREKGAFNMPSKESDREKGAFNNYPKESGRGNGLYNGGQERESTNVRRCSKFSKFPNLPYNDVNANDKDKGRGLSGIGRGGGTPPINQLALKQKYLGNVLDEREVDSAKDAFIISEESTLQAQIDKPSGPNWT